MPPHALPASQKPIETPAPAAPRKQTTKEYDESLFEHAAWVYAFCREHLFRDDTTRMITALWPNGGPAPGIQLVELGCGPGFYSCALAERFHNISITGVDRSEQQLKRARERARVRRLNNCCFKRVNALRLSDEDTSFHIVVASRLFTILAEPNRVIDEMYRVLKPGGRCFVAEPRFAFWASIPLFAMWLLAGVTHSRNGYREPQHAAVFSTSAFEKLFTAQPWKQRTIWKDGRYQYALCEKP
jgi:ubiquinone/menaquinone biosynthesis C-methylase UbiE